jgi:hypothetical protein
MVLRRSAEPEEAAQVTLSLLLPAACTSRGRSSSSMAGGDPERVRPTGLQTIRQPNVKGASAW